MNWLDDWGRIYGLQRGWWGFEPNFLFRRRIRQVLRVKIKRERKEFLYG